ncbi:Protein HEG [Larimichthys crocea]|uniref:Uncharacterized protein n=1 Tax=Larimichthys crocea TaxID=215358 RepID=A0ACD3QJE2_LARCR|nr:Protein HEG [Larimichthys crocea]
MFSISTDVTSAEVNNSIQMFLSNCSSSLAHCRMVLHHQLDFHVESLCVAQKTQCDTERSTCTDDSGTAHCQCLQGYYKHNPEDQSCLECGDGYKLENGTCVPCMFGFGGFNCGNFYKLIAVVVSPAGGALLLILVIALIVTCCKKDKNDINKIIFKSGDLQMSPYADFAKNNRISMEWGRETIEMQENGSTKNLLQMTDIYYSRHIKSMAQGGGSFSTPRIQSQKRVTTTGISQGVFFILYSTFYYFDALTYRYSKGFHFGAWIAVTAATLYISVTTVNLGIGQSIFRQRAADTWKALKAVCGVGMVKNDVKVYSSQLTLGEF